MSDQGRGGRAAARWLSGFSCGLMVGVGLSLADFTRSAARRSRPVSPVAEEPDRLRRWRTVVVRSVRAFGVDQIPAAAAGVTFYILLGLFPALSAFASLFGLFADVEQARRQIVQTTGLLPGGAINVLGDQLERLAAANHAMLGEAFFISLLVSLWSANAGVKALIAALNVAYEVKEKRGFIRLNLISLALTAGGVVLAAAAIGADIAAPSALARLGLGGIEGVRWLRWPLWLILTTALISALYRFGPSHQRARWRWITPGGAFAALSWLVMSGLFSWYVANFGRYNQTYGSLGAIVGFLTWIWLSLMVVMFGAELNAQIATQQGRPAGT